MKPSLTWRQLRVVVTCAAFIGALLVAIHLSRNYENALVLLLRLERKPGSAWLASMTSHSVDVTDEVFALPNGSVRARLYTPQGVHNPSALVLVHGVHRLGMDDPRLMLLAKSFAERGVLVLTPELKQLEDYRVEPSEIDVIGESAKYLQSRTGVAVGVLGVSFSGSLSLLAAADKRYSPSICCVIAIGAYDDLTHIAHFLFTEEAELPDGTFHKQVAEQYGALVMVYSHPEQYFTTADSVPAQAALKLWLQEQYAGARAAEAALSPAGQSELEALFQHRLQPFESDINTALADDAAEMQRVSPHGQLASLHVPVFLLHGLDDEVIPSAETRWLEHDVPAPWLRRALITPAFGHVDANAHVTLQSQWELVSFMAAVFRQLESGSQSWSSTSSR